MKKLNKTQFDQTSVDSIKVEKLKNEIEFFETDPAFACEEIEEVKTNNQELEETIFGDNLAQIENTDCVQDIEEITNYEDSLVIDENLLQEMEQGGNIFDTPKQKNQDALVDTFLLKDKKLKHIDSPFLEQGEQIKEKVVMENKESSEVAVKENTGKIAVEEIKASEKTEDNTQSKQEQRAKLLAISEHIMNEQEVASLNINNNSELGEKVKNIQSPFNDIEGKERAKLNNNALKISPFLVPTAIGSVATEKEEKKEPTIITEKVIEKQTPIVIQNVQKVNNEEINNKMQMMAERIDKLSQMIMPLENINQVLNERLTNLYVQRIEKPEKTNIGDEIICDVCGHINKKGSSVCEQCSNIFENA